MKASFGEPGEIDFQSSDLGSRWMLYINFVMWYVRDVYDKYHTVVAVHRLLYSVVWCLVRGARQKRKESLQ